MEENNMPEKITEDQLETVALHQEEKMEEKPEGKKCDKCVFLVILGLIFLIAMLALYVWNLYGMQLANDAQRAIDQIEINIPDTTDKGMEKPDSEKSEEELLDELTGEVEDDLDNMELEMDQMDTELNELENAQLTE
jgi:flagellar basal body-associated protein FliL